MEGAGRKLGSAGRREGGRVVSPRRPTFLLPGGDPLDDLDSPRLLSESDPPARGPDRYAPRRALSGAVGRAPSLNQSVMYSEEPRLPPDRRIPFKLPGRPALSSLSAELGLKSHTPPRPCAPKAALVGGHRHPDCSTGARPMRLVEGLVRGPGPSTPVRYLSVPQWSPPPEEAVCARPGAGSAAPCAQRAGQPARDCCGKERTLPALGWMHRPPRGCSSPARALFRGRAGGRTVRAFGERWGTPLAAPLLARRQ